MADVYVLPSPSPTLYVYPSAQHPAAVGGPLLGPVFQPHRRTAPARGRGRLQFRVTVAASARLRAAQARSHRTTLTARLRPARTAGRLPSLVASATTQPLVVRATERGRTQVTAGALVRCADHRHLSLPPVVFDLLLESWDD